MKVIVLIVNYKNWKDTIECLESVLKSNYRSFEVVVVDNSPDYSSMNNFEDWAKGNKVIGKTSFPELVFPNQPKPLDYILISEEEYHKSTIEVKNDITFVKAANNNGFAAANNVVLKKLMKSRDNGFVFLLNNDTVIPKNTLSNFVNNYNSNSLGIAGGVLLEYSDPNRVQSVGGLYNNIFGTTSQVLEGLNLEELKSDQTRVKIDYPCGAAMFLSIKVLKEIGLLNENFFLYYEEFDWIKKSSSKYNTTYFKDCLVYHKGGVSIESNKKSYLADKYSIINRINFAKIYNRSNIITVYIGVVLSIFKRLLFFKFKRSYNIIKDVLKNEN